MVCVTLPVRASSLVTVPASWLVTQTDPPPTAIPSALRPTGIVRSTLSFRMSMRLTVPSLEFATQT